MAIIVEAAARILETEGFGGYAFELINGPMLFEHKATPAEYSVRLKFMLERGWLEIHESGTYVKFTQAGAELFA